MGNESGASALARIQSLLDEFSFVEIGGLVEARSTDFNMAGKKLPSDGVVTGYGTIEGSLVYVYAQDASVLGGSVGEMHAKKIANVYDMAIKMGAPVIGILDSSGIRLEEASDGMFGLGRLYRKQTLASGVIPQITAIFGQAGGGMAVLSALSDFTYMEGTKARLFVNPPDAVKGNKDEGYAMAERQEQNGLVDFSGSEEEIFSEIRRLVSLLPGSFENEGVSEECTDDLNRSVAGIEQLPMAEALRQLSDNGLFVQTRRAYAADMLTGFLQINGQTVGVVANAAQKLSWQGADQAAGLVRFCDAFEIPILTVTDVKGYSNEPESERHLAKAAARLAYAYSNASVPMVTIIKNAYGTAGLGFGSKALGADMVYAYPDAEIALMDAGHAAEILFAEGDAEKAEKTKEIREKQCSALSAAKRGYVDAVIRPEESRQRVAAAFEMLYTKSVFQSDKKHGTA